MNKLFSVTFQTESESNTRIYQVEKIVGKYVYLFEPISFRKYLIRYDGKKYVPVKMQKHEQVLVQSIGPTRIVDEDILLTRNSDDYISTYYKGLPAEVRNCRKGNITDSEFISLYAYLSYHSMTRFAYYLTDRENINSSSEQTFYKSQTKEEKETVNNLINLLWKYPHRIQDVSDTEFGPVITNIVPFIEAGLYDTTEYFDKLNIEVQGGVYKKNYIPKRELRSIEADFIYQCILNSPDNIPSIYILDAVFKNFVSRLDDDEAEMVENIKNLHSMIIDYAGNQYNILLASLTYEKNDELFNYFISKFTGTNIDENVIKEISIPFFLYWIKNHGTIIFENTFGTSRVDLWKIISTKIDINDRKFSIQTYIYSTYVTNLKRIYDYVVTELSMFTPARFRELFVYPNTAINNSIDKNDLEEISFLLNYTNQDSVYFISYVTKNGSDESIKLVLDKFKEELNSGQILRHLESNMKNRNCDTQSLILSYIKIGNIIAFFTNLLYPKSLLEYFNNQYKNEKAEKLNPKLLNIIEQLIEYFQERKGYRQDYFPDEENKIDLEYENKIVEFYCEKKVGIYGDKFRTYEYHKFFKLNDITKMQILLNNGFRPHIELQVQFLADLSKTNMNDKHEFEAWIAQNPILSNMDEKYLKYCKQLEEKTTMITAITHPAELDLKLSYEYLYNIVKDSLHFNNYVIEKMLFRSASLLDRPEIKTKLENILNEYNENTEDIDSQYSYSRYNFYIITSNNPIFIEKMHEMGFLKETGFGENYDEVGNLSDETVYLYNIYKYSQVDGKIIVQFEEDENDNQSFRIPDQIISQDDITLYLNSYNMNIFEVFTKIFPLEIHSISQMNAYTQDAIVFVSKYLGRVYDKNLIDEIKTKVDQKYKIVEQYLKICQLMKYYPLLLEY